MTAPSAALSKALFLDRDGTLIVDSHYLSDPDRVEVMSGVPEGLRRALSLGYKLFLFSNQSGVGRGYYTLEDALKVNARMEELLKLPKPLFTGVCMATEKPDEPAVYRKPSPRYINEMIALHRLDPQQSFMVGDRETDIDAGLAAGIRVAGLTNGKLDRRAWGKFGYKDLPLFDDLAEFAATLT